jgi:integrase
MTDTRRTYGTGSLYERNGAWVGHWRSNGRQIKRQVGPVRNGKAGLTRPQAEAALRAMIATTNARPIVGERIDIAELAARYLTHSERRGRKRSTMANIESEVRVHIAPFFHGKAIDAIAREDVADFIAALENKRLAPKSVANINGTLAAMFNFARKRRWATANPCDGVDLPAIPEQVEIKFLTLAEVDALIAHARRGEFHDLDGVMYRVAAMTGLRLGELLALRWMDVDWPAMRIRVRQNYVRGEYGTPKSKRSTRSVPMADEVAGALDRHFQRTGLQSDDDLVFGHPLTGMPMYRQGITRRLHRALTAAGIDAHVFHDLRHTFGTRCAAAGVPMRTLQEWMGHRDITTTQRYADYAPSTREADMVATAFARGSNQVAIGPNRTASCPLQSDAIAA